MIFNSDLVKLVASCLISMVVCASANAVVPSYNANATTLGILSYVYWPAQLKQINFCVVDGVPQALERQSFVVPSPLLHPRQLYWNPVTSSQLLKNTNQLRACHVLYFVHSPDTVQQRLISNATLGTLSLSENNKDCSIGSAFCVYQQSTRYMFKVNLSALSRSKVQINSKVMQLLQTQERHIP